MGPQPRSLPVEVIETEILPRLPALSLLRFRSVCKLWNSIISDPDFVKSHLNCTSRNPNDENLVMLKRLPPAPEDEYSSHKVSILSSLDLKETILSDHLVTLVPYPTKYFTSLSLTGSVNGLLCLFLGEVHKFVIWNPILRQAKIIDAPIKESMTLMFHGFGWDAVNNDYKLVMHFFKRRNYVYSCKSNRWTSLTNLSVFPTIDRRVPSVIVKGVPYWTATRYKHEENTRYMLPFKFEVGSNEFRYLPEFECGERCQDNFFLVNLNECISTLEYKTHSSDCSVDVYCLDDSCGVWRKMYNVGPISYVKKLSHCFTHGGQIVLNIEKEVMCYDPKIKKMVSNTGKEEVVCCDPKINKIKGVGNTKGELIKCYSYKASLVYLEGMKPLHQQAKCRISDSCEMKSVKRTTCTEHSVNCSPTRLQKRPRRNAHKPTWTRDYHM